MRPIETVLVGFGASARIFQAPHLNALPEFNFRGVLERSSNTAQSIYPEIKVYHSVQEVLADSGVELVIISTPNSTHYPLAQTFLNAGIHVVVEKPFTITYKEALRLTALAKKKNRVLSVFHNRRWDGDFLAVSQILRSEELGRVVSFESRFERFSNTIRKKPWKETPGHGSSLLEDLGSHLVDQALVLFGSPNSVFCRLAIQRDNSQVPDSFVIFLTYPQIQVTLTAGMLVQEPPFRFLIQGTKGTYLKKFLDPQEARLSQGENPLSEEIGRESENHWGEIFLTSGDKKPWPTPPGSYKTYFQSLASALRNGSKNPLTSEEAALTIKVLELCRKSAATGKTMAVRG